MEIGVIGVRMNERLSALASFIPVTMWLVSTNSTNRVPPGSGDVRDLLHRRDTAPFYSPLPTSRWGLNE